jgi:hypothetical protein
MGDLASAIARAANGGDPRALYTAVKSLPKRPTDARAVDPRGDDDPGPIPGESFDDVTTAWIMGRISDQVYTAAIRAATS